MTRIVQNIALDIFSLDKLVAAIDTATANIPATDTREWALEGIVKRAIAQAIASGYLKTAEYSLNQATKSVTVCAYTTGKVPHFIQLLVQ